MSSHTFITEHCDLCDHKITDFKTGIRCGLTYQKPQFYKTCSKISLKKVLELRIKDIHLELDQYRRSRFKTYYHFIFYIGVGLLLIATGCGLGFHINDFEKSSHVLILPLLLTLSCIPFFGISIKTLNKYKQATAAARNKQQQLDKILNLYGITYDIKISYSDEFHGTQEVFLELDIKRH
ncbi:hypothetical protein [Nonlabens sp.]|uniref:hypothetical protein n=1 Tax=Nonlabens sp. TaxID=1888209 RepID=UPI003F69E472